MGAWIAWCSCLATCPYQAVPLRPLAGSCAGDLELRCHLSRAPHSGLHPLHEAAGAGDTEALAQLLLQLPPGEPLPRDTVGNSPLHRAAALGQPHAAWALLAHCGEERACAELAAVNAVGWTPAHACCANPDQPGASGTLEVLGCCGAELSARTAPEEDPQFECWAGDTCLGLAAQHATSPAALPVVQALLLAQQSPLEPAGWLGTSPLEYAAGGGGGC